MIGIWVELCIWDGCFGGCFEHERVENTSDNADCTQHYRVHCVVDLMDLEIRIIQKTF